MKSQGRMHFITKRVVKNHFEVKFTKKLTWKFTVSYRSKLTEEALKLQVILEKHGLELCGSSYTWIFFSVVNILVVCNLWLVEIIE